MTSEVSAWRAESERIAHERESNERRQARYEDAQAEENFRFKPWDPFGKPYSGAPPPDSNKRRRGPGFASDRFEIPRVAPNDSFHDRRLWKSYEEKAVRTRAETQREKDFYDKFGTPGAGAPLRTEDGTIITSRLQHDDLVMQANIVGKKTFLNAVPPVHRDPGKVSQYKKDLDNQYYQKVVQMSLDKERELHLERQRGGPYEFGEKERMDDPFRGHRKPTLHITQEESEAYDPWGKSYPERDANGNVKRHKHSTVRNGIVQLVGSTEESVEHQKEIEKAGGKRESKLQMISDANGAQFYEVLADEKFVPYDPFGKPGAGAPRRDDAGKVQTRLPRFSVTDPVIEKQRQWSNKVYLNQIKEAINEHQLTKADWEYFDRAQCENFADIVERSKVGKVRRNPNTGFIQGTPLASTDITKPEVRDKVPEEVPARLKYYSELQNQVEDRDRRRALDSIRERQEANQHYDTQNHFWGRRGPGANPSKLQLHQPPFRTRQADVKTSSVGVARHDNLVFNSKPLLRSFSSRAYRY